MADRQATDNVLGSYLSLVRSVLPTASCVALYGSEGGLVATDSADGGSAVPTLLPEPLRDAIGSGKPSMLRVTDTDQVLLPLARTAGDSLGVFVVTLPVADRDGAADLETLTTVLLPVTTTLVRELTLRCKLLEAYQKLSVQAAEERLLHQVEGLAHAPGQVTRMLQETLHACRSCLGIQAAALVFPALKLHLNDGRPLAEPLLSGLLAAAAEPRQRSTAEIRSEGEVCAVTVRHGSAANAGLLVLAGWGGSAFSERRRARIARYIGSHVEYVLEREYDDLTGLLSGACFEIRLAEAGADGDSHACTVMYLDVDQLHVANDTLGRDSADLILVDLARILSEELDGHVIARLASDSFAVLLRDTPIDRARAHAERVLARFRDRQFERGGRTYRPSVSIGLGPLGTEADGSPLALAETACRAAKDRGRGRVEAYESADASIIRRFDDMHLVGAVRQAINRNRLVLLAQPIVPTRPDESRRYFEVLVRLLDDHDRLVAPGEFLSAAERYQLMEELDRWVFESTLQLLESRIDAIDAANARFAINLSGQTLGSESFLEFVREKLDASRVAPSLLTFEITETVAVANMQRAQSLMHALKRMGCRFSLDDFGTGLSSFAYLKLFPVDTLKIDGSFIRDLSSNVVSQSVVAAISEVARVMQLETVAEYVEDEQSLAMLAQLGVTWAQGYLIGAPLPLTEAVAALGAPTPLRATGSSAS